MIAPSFDTLYLRLARAARRYHAIHRSPDEVVALAEAHWELHLARKAIAAERSRLEAVGAVYTSGDRRWLDGVGIEPSA